MKSEVETPQPIASIPLPSADYIQLRFDQNDKAVAELKKESGDRFDKLTDKIDTFTSQFATRDDVKELQVIADKEHKKLWEAIDRINRSARWWIATGLAIVVATAAIITAIKTR
jgi:hypothetical protein